MRIIFLGTGTSTGIPEVGCFCPVCQSSDPRDVRQRTSALVITDQGKRILIDCGPDFRRQALDIDLDRVDAVLITHHHVDHVGGLDDLRTISWRESLPIYGQGYVLEAIRSRMPYVFSDNPYPGTPKFELIEISENTPFELFGIPITPILVHHGNLPILGYRIGNISYITDMKTATAEQWAKVSGSDLLVVNALRHFRPHPSHQSLRDVEQILPTLDQQPKLTLLTHLSHHAPSHADIERLASESVRPAYDGLMVRVDGGEITLGKYQSPEESLHIRDLGHITYSEALQEQEQLFDQFLQFKSNRTNTISEIEPLPRPKNSLLLCEHNPVFTIGKHGKDQNLLISEDYLREQGYELFHVSRGGDITYHGPGQITGYPILDLESYGLGIKAYIDLMEEVIIKTLAFYNIKGERNPNATGVWIEPQDRRRARKICAIGVRSSRYVTMHGFALNVNTDLNAFRLINPCGFVDGQVSSIASELGEEIDMTVTKAILAKYFYDMLQQRLPDRYLSSL